MLQLRNKCKKKKVIISNQITLVEQQTGNISEQKLIVGLFLIANYKISVAFKDFKYHFDVRRF